MGARVLGGGERLHDRCWGDVDALWLYNYSLKDVIDFSINCQ